MVLTSSTVIQAEHLPLHVQDVMEFKPELGFKRSKLQAIEHFEREALASYLPQAGGNISRAALMAKYKVSARSAHSAQ